jgi:limonene-1,2-epoxide hydrolase
MASKFGLADMAEVRAAAYVRAMDDTSPARVVEAWSRALNDRDFERARSFLADDLHFEGPIDTFDRADDYVTAIRNLMGMARGMEHQGVLAQGDDVAVFYRLDTPVAVAPVAEWYTVRDGKIVTLRAYFDARPFAQGGPRQPA